MAPNVLRAGAGKGAMHSAKHLRSIVSLHRPRYLMWAGRYHPHFLDEETGAWRGSGTPMWRLGSDGQSWTVNPGLSGSCYLCL